MVSKPDHYQRLGVARDESDEGIRRAFRQRAKECHPDCAGPEGESAFKDLAEAHEILSDPDQRRRYDDRLRQDERPHARPTPVRSSVTPSPVWPSPSGWSSWGGVPIRDVPVPQWRPAEEERSRVADLDVVLTPSEALTGGRLPVRFVHWLACPACDGTGSDMTWGTFPALCLECRGAGLRPRVISFELPIPPGVNHGEVLVAATPPTGAAGSLRVRLRIVIDPFA